MSLPTFTLSLEPELHRWATEAAVEEGLTVESFVAGLVKEERTRRALESMVAWVREDADGPSLEEMDELRSQMLGEDKS